MLRDVYCRIYGEGYSLLCNVEFMEKGTVYSLPVRII
jgi:hypothetical protein